MNPLIMFMYILPIAEIAAFIYVGSTIGILETISIILLTTVAGLYIIRYQGVMTLKGVMQQIPPKVSNKELSQSLCMIIAGICLIIPGFITDIVGVLILIPFSRKIITKILKLKFRTSDGKNSDKDSDILEGEFYEVDSHESISSDKNENKEK